MSRRQGHADRIRALSSPLYTIVSISGRGGGAMQCYAEIATDAEILAQALYALEEPWRSRFLCLVASLATGAPWNGRLPTQEEVTAWLGNWHLHREVTLMVHAWRRGLAGSYSSSGATGRYCVG